MNKLKLYTCKNCGAVGIDDGTGEIKWAENLEVFNKFTGLNITKKDLKNDWYDTSYTILKFHPKVVKFMDNLLLN